MCVRALVWEKPTNRRSLQADVYTSVVFFPRLTHFLFTLAGNINNNQTNSLSPSDIQERERETVSVCTCAWGRERKSERETYKQKLFTKHAIRGHNVRTPLWKHCKLFQIGLKCFSATVLFRLIKLWPSFNPFIGYIPSFARSFYCRSM